MTHRPPRRPVTGAVALAASLTATLVATLAAACSSEEPPVSPNETFPPPSAYDLVLDQVGPGGEVSLETALAAFSLAIAPLEGTPEPPGPRDPIASGTAAVRWTLGRWADLTAEQKAAVSAALATPDSGSLAMIPVAHTQPQAPAGAPVPDCPRADSADAGALRRVLDDGIAEIANRLGRTLSIPTFLVLHKEPQFQARMYMVPCAGTDMAVTTRPDGCAIHVNPQALTAEVTDSDRRNFLIHEATHCFLADRLGPREWDLPPWLAEGIPTFVQAALGGTDLKVREYWHEYLELDHKALFARVYDSLGFFAQVANSGVDLWPNIDLMTDAYLAGGNAAAWTASGLGDPFLRTWAPGHVRGARDGVDSGNWDTAGAWDIVGYGIPAYWPPMRQFDPLAVGDTATAAAPATAVDVIRFVLPPDAVVRVTAEPTARGLLGLPGLDLSLENLGRTDLCTAPAGCACPAGSAAEPRVINAGEGYLGVTGGLGPAQVTLQVASVDEYCAQPATTCVVGTWVMTGTDLTVDTGIHLTGGAGVEMTIAADGATTMNYTPMQPVSVAANTADLSLLGELRYDGVVAAQLDLPDPGVTEGELVATHTDVTGLTVSFRYLPPVDVVLLDRVPFAELTSDLAFGAGAMPLGNRVTFTCTPTTLDMGAPTGNGGWSWTRA